MLHRYIWKKRNNVVDVAQVDSYQNESFQYSIFILSGLMLEFS